MELERESKVDKDRVAKDKKSDDALELIKGLKKLLADMKACQKKDESPSRDTRNRSLVSDRALDR
jgi:hypothetical protein